MICIDGHATKKTEIVMHHAVSDDMVNWSDARVAKWFSDVGRNRGYAGVAHSYHCNPSGNYESFSQAQYCLHRYTANGNKYGWRLTLLIAEPFRNACWHASNWTANKRSLGIETAGNFVGKYLDEKALMLVADTFRAYDKSIGGILDITGHKKYAATACPGKIYEQLGTMIDMFNNPDKWNKKLWPTPVPPPVNDNIYRVMKGTIQVGAYKIRDNAFNKWYTDKSQKVVYNGKDITSEFTAMANVLEKKIVDLEKKVSTLEADGKTKDARISELEKAAAKLIETNQELKAYMVMTETQLRTLSGLPADATTEDCWKKITDELISLKKQVTDLGKKNVKLTKDLAVCTDISKNFINSIWGKLYLIFNKPKNGSEA